MAMSKKNNTSIDQKENKETNKIVYFRDRAAKLGCKNVDELGDLAVWDYVIANQPK